MTIRTTLTMTVTEKGNHGGKTTSKTVVRAIDEESG